MVARRDGAARSGISFRSGERVLGATGAWRDHQYQPFRHHVLYPDWLSWIARLIWPVRTGHASRRGDERRDGRNQAIRLRGRHYVLAFRRRGVGIDLHCDLSMAAGCIADSLKAARRIANSKM